jgi:hypothetical protein
VGCLLAGLVVALGTHPGAAAATQPQFTSKKSIWGPVDFRGKPQFPIYHQLGAGIWQSSLNWSDTAPTEPAHPTDPSDPAYRWPADLDRAVVAARRYGIRISLLVAATPGWANGGRPPNWVPSKPGQLADFLTAASRRYPTVKLWMIWGEPSRHETFMPLTPERHNATRLTPQQAAAPRYYARMLDAAYGALKGVSKSNLVIGGNTFIAGDITPYNWVRYLRLPNGRRPRMDMYGHNPFTGRQPKLHAPHHISDVDFSDLPKFVSFLDHQIRTPAGRPLRLFLSEFFLPTDHANVEFPFHVSWKLQAAWLRDALKITRSWQRIYTLGWLALYDDPPRPDGLSVNRGLMTYRGRRKPSFFVFQSG